MVIDAVGAGVGRVSVPPMASWLVSRQSALGSMAVGAYWAVRLEGLRMPVRRVVAQMARISEATLSRRFAGVCAEEALMVELVRARRQTYPRQIGPVPWSTWIADSQEEVDDVRVWAACEQLAATSPRLAEAVVEVWDEQRRRLAAASPCDAATVSALHAVISGLNARRVLDEEFSHAEAAAILCHVVQALGAVGTARALSAADG